MLSRNYLSQEALTGLKNYKYQSGEYSFMDKVMTPCWNYAVTFLPMWMAPNLVTLIGFIVIILSAFQYLPFDLSLAKECNPICYALSGLAFFIYQTLDAIDGKQARRTGQSSPLGQLFDHGCDAWSTIFMIYTPMQVFRFGTNFAFFQYFFLLMVGFYTANWEEYHTDVLRTSLNGFGLTECQLLMISMLLVEGFTQGKMSQITMRDLGVFIAPSVSETQVQTKIQYLLNSTIIHEQDSKQLLHVQDKVHSFAELKMIQVILIVATSTIIWQAYSNITTVYAKSKKPFSEQMSGLLPLVIIAAFLFASFKFTNEAWASPALVVFGIGPFFSLCCSRIIIGSVSKTKFSLLEHFHLTLPTLFFIALLPVNKIFSLHLSEKVIFFAMIGVGLFTYFLYIVNTIGQITQCLDIYCLSIKKPKGG